MKTGIRTPGTRSRKSSTVSNGGVPPSTFRSQSRQGSVNSDESGGSLGSRSAVTGVIPTSKPVSKVPQPNKPIRPRTLSGSASGIPSLVPPPTLGARKSMSGLRQPSTPSWPGGTKLQRSESGPPASRIGVSIKKGSGSLDSAVSLLLP